MEILSSVADELQFKLTQIENTVKLFDEGATVPFIARYRKEVTGNLDEEQIRDVIEKVTYYRNLEKRKEEVLRLIEEQGKLTDELKKSIESAKKLQEVEDCTFHIRKRRRRKRMWRRNKDWSLYRHLRYCQKRRWKHFGKRLKSI